MNITILVYGSLGDVQPYAALGAGLKSFGYDVTVAADPSFKPLIDGFGLSFAPVAGNPVDVVNCADARVALDSGANLLRRARAYKAFTRNFSEHVGTNLDESWEACRGSDVFVFALNSFAGYHVAERLNVPSFGISIAPYTRTRTMPSIHFADWPSLGEGPNMLTHLLTERLFFLPPASGAINEWRKKTLDLPPLSSRGHLRTLAEHSKIPILYSYSPTLFPAPVDWPPWIHVTGYWFPEASAEWTPPKPLVDFLEAGSVPVYIGFGSMAQTEWIRPETRVGTIIGALDHARQRGIVSFGPNVPSDIALPDHVFRVESVPHDWLFRRVSMTVHHGGSGTTSQSLRAGVPMQITPFMWDQPFWGRRVMAAGLGPQAIPYNKLDATSLGDAIRGVLANSSMQAAARSAGERVRRENGVERAVRIVETYLAAKRSVIRPGARSGGQTVRGVRARAARAAGAV